MITALYAGLLALLFVILSAYVIFSRRSNKISLLDGNNEDLRRRIRMHGNFAEYVPLILVLMMILELSGYPNFVIHLFGVLLVISRVLHPIGMLKTTSGVQRVAGTAITLILLSLTGLLSILAFLFKA